MAVWNACLAHHARYAGLHRAVLDFARACRGPILSFDSSATADSFDAESRVHVIAVKSWPPDGPFWLSRQTQRRASELLEAADGLIVHSLFRAHCDFAVEWAKRTRKPYWSVPHGCLDPWGLSRRRIAKRLWLARSGEKFFDHCRSVVFSTRGEHEKGQRWIGSARVTVIPWPVDRPDMSERSSRRAAFRREHGIAQEARVLLFVGRLHSMKRPRELIDAFVAAAEPGCDLVVVGMDGDLRRDALNRHAASLGSSRVHVVGPLYDADLVACIAAADGFISLSHRENYGYAVADALAGGLPVILTPGHDLAHDLPMLGAAPDSCGWLLSDEALAAAVPAIRAFAATGQPLLESMGHTADNWARVHLGRDQFASALVSETNSTSVHSATFRQGVTHAL
jgi:glycosyltransferase involved in cell wall biosynthesis